MARSGFGASTGPAIAGLVDGAVVLVDGLIASTVPSILVPEAAGSGWSFSFTCHR